MTARPRCSLRVTSTTSSALSSKWSSRCSDTAHNLGKLARTN
jgi:hypothetical protein